MSIPRYKCPLCGAKYLECDLRKVKCSENGTYSYIVQYCPKCFRRKKLAQLNTQEV